MVSLSNHPSIPRRMVSGVEPLVRGCLDLRRETQRQAKQPWGRKTDEFHPCRFALQKRSWRGDFSLWHGHPFDYAQDKLGRVFTPFRNKISNGVHGLEARATATSLLFAEVRNHTAIKEVNDDGQGY
jgi:hypothetical protein